jgi:hypothetical protein
VKSRLIAHQAVRLSKANLSNMEKFVPDCSPDGHRKVKPRRAIAIIDYRDAAVTLPRRETGRSAAVCELDTAICRLYACVQPLPGHRVKDE